MRTIHLLVTVVGLAAVLTGCKKQQAPVQKGVSAGPPAGTLPQDTAYATGKVQAAVLELQTKLDVPALAVEGAAVDDEVKRAQESSAFRQIMMVSDDRGKLVFNTEDLHIPKGTELRYNPAHKAYVLADAAKKAYWTMSGAELGSLLEGGPSVQRSNYTIAVTDTSEQATIAGVQAVRSDADLGFEWAVSTKNFRRKANVKVKLAIWHSGDARLKPAWGSMMVDFLTVPFQDPEGQKVIAELKRRVKFPVKWSMEVINQSQVRQPGEAPARLVTEAVRLDVNEVDRLALASPPAGFNPANEPYEFPEGGQTAKGELLGKITPRQGPPPANLEPPDQDEKTP